MIFSPQSTHSHDATNVDFKSIREKKTIMGSDLDFRDPDIAGKHLFSIPQIISPKAEHFGGQSIKTKSVKECDFPPFF